MTSERLSGTGGSQRTLLVGGARSGKSAIGQRLAERWPGPVTVVVTAEPFDDEMADRIERHRNDRPSEWNTLEAPYELAAAVSSVAAGDHLLLDCVTIWLSNHLVHGDGDDVIETACAELIEALGAHDGPVVVISNEVGFGLVPPDPLSRRFRDAQGRLNQMLSASVDRSYLVVAGSLLPLSAATDILPELA